MNVLGALLGQPGAPGRNSLVQQDNGQGGNFGFRKGDWKLVRGREQYSQPRAGANWPRKKGSPGDRLYHLAEDPAELYDLSAQQPAKLAELQQDLDRLLQAGRSR